MAWTSRPPGQVAFRGDLTPPVTSYAYASRNTSLIAQNRIQHSSNRTNSAVVNRRPRRKGLKYWYSYGSDPMNAPMMPTPGRGGVASSLYQTLLTTLHDWSTNSAWFEAGYPRNLGWVTRVPQLSTKYTGGPGDSAMDAKPRFVAVQSVRRYSVTPRVYPTKSANG